MLSRRQGHLLWLLAYVADAAHEETTEVAPVAELPGQFSRSYTNYATKLRRHLLHEYDKTVPPMSDRTAVRDL